MAVVPKKKHSRARRNRRRAHWKITPPTLTECPRCHEMKRPHHVCISCGYYKGRKVANV